MNVVVVYERHRGVLAVREHGTRARSVEAAPGPEEYDAVVIGSII
jgi:hypothetical protein